MKTLATIALGTTAFVVLSACSFIKVDLDGVVETQSFDVGDFTSIQLNGSGDVTIVEGTQAGVTVTADTAVIDDIQLKNANGELQISEKFGWAWFDGEVDYVITVTDLEGIELNGSGTFTALSVDTDAITVDISGSGDVTLAGRANTFSADVSGSGDINSVNLTAEHVSIQLAGSGTFEVYASKTLDIDISGSGDVTYYGDPDVTSDVAGSGDIQAG